LDSVKMGRTVGLLRERGSRRAPTRAARGNVATLRGQTPLQGVDSAETVCGGPEERLRRRGTPSPTARRARSDGLRRHGA
jgi:hypothetical protein